MSIKFTIPKTALSVIEDGNYVNIELTALTKRELEELNDAVCFELYGSGATGLHFDNEEELKDYIVDNYDPSDLF